jgi:hypothetical protein
VHGMYSHPTKSEQEATVVNNYKQETTMATSAVYATLSVMYCGVGHSHPQKPIHTIPIPQHPTSATPPSLGAMMSATMYPIFRDDTIVFALMMSSFLRSLGDRPGSYEERKTRRSPSHTQESKYRMSNSPQQINLKSIYRMGICEPCIAAISPAPEPKDPPSNRGHMICLNPDQVDVLRRELRDTAIVERN